MSVRLMSQIWDMDFSPVEKLVLLALADWANDDGLAWPSITQLARKTGCGERTVQRTLRDAERRGVLVRDEVKGKGCKYVLDPRQTGAPARQAPVPDRRETPATLAPNTSGHTKPQKASPSSGSARERKANPFPRPDWADAGVWRDFLANRKLKRLNNTPTAHKRFLADIDRHADDDWPPGRLLEAATAKGWGAIYPSIKETDDGHQPGRRMDGKPDLRGARADPALDMLNAARRAEEAERPGRDWEDRGGAWPALPALGAR